MSNERNRMEQKAIQHNEKAGSLGEEKKVLEKKIKMLEKEAREQSQLFQQAQ